MRLAVLLSLAVACSREQAPPPVIDTEEPPVGGDTAPVVDTPDIDPEALHGTVPPAAVAAPEFAARNQLGEARARPDLIGHPTVLWFFPASGTPG
jgi:hypothetical protein